MRKHIPNHLKEVFRIALIQTRDEVKLSQEEMAHRLAMATRSYIDMENGMSCCSAVTFILFLLYVCLRCKSSLDREYMSYCDQCGQCLNWRGCKKAIPIYIQWDGTRK